MLGIGRRNASALGNDQPGKSRIVGVRQRITGQTRGVMAFLIGVGEGDPPLDASQPLQIVLKLLAIGVSRPTSRAAS